MDTSFDLTNKKYTKNTNNNDPPNDNDDDNNVDCSPWHNKQPVLPKLITKRNKKPITLMHSSPCMKWQI